jgi:hypothetical protein
MYRFAVLLYTNCTTNSASEFTTEDFRITWCYLHTLVVHILCFNHISFLILTPIHIDTKIINWLGLNFYLFLSTSHRGASIHLLCSEWSIRPTTTSIPSRLITAWWPQPFPSGKGHQEKDRWVTSSFMKNNTNNIKLSWTQI